MWNPAPFTYLHMTMLPALLAVQSTQPERDGWEGGRRMGRDRMCVKLISKLKKEKPTTISLCLGYYNTWMTGSRRSSSKGIVGSWLLKVWSCWYYSHVKPVGLLPSVLSPTSILHINKSHAGTHTHTHTHTHASRLVWDFISQIVTAKEVEQIGPKTW